MSTGKQDKRLGRVMLALYKDTDQEARERADSLQTTCRKGCSDCCHLLISVTFPEAVAIAEELLRNPAREGQMKRLMPTLYAQIATIAEGAEKKEPGHYFKAGSPCVFLDSETKTCTIYEQRPSSCRLHYVVTEPALCSPTVEATVGRVNMEDISLRHLRVAEHVSMQASVPLWSGPFQVMLLWALKLLTEGRSAIETAHAEKLGIMSLQLWRLRLDTPTSK